MNATHTTSSPSYSNLTGMVKVALPLWKLSTTISENIARLDDPLTLQLMKASVDSWVHPKTAFIAEPTGSDIFEGITENSENPS